MSTVFRTLIEKVQAEHDIHQINLPVKVEKLSPILSIEAVNLHYGLYKKYVKNALNGEGAFQLAGAKLHTMFFEQLRETSNKQPTGPIKFLIDSKFNSFSDFKDKITESAMSIHGSGWVYLTTNGTIKIIKNHEIVDDVAVIIDMWEHSYIIDYGANKEKYLNNIWKIIDWDVINIRLN